MRRIFLLAIFFLPILIGCEQASQRPKYVFLFIGDGMGIQQVNATQTYLDSVIRSNKRISFIDFPKQTFATTYAATRYITCSAAAGTALSTGSKTSIGTIGLNYNHRDSLFSIAKKFKENGYKVGILTSVGIDDATPAAFYAHQGSRGSRYDIAKDLIKSHYNFFASGGFYDPYGKKLRDSVESIYSIGKRNSFVFTKNIEAIDSLCQKNQSVVFENASPTSESSFKYAIDSDSSDVTLAQLTQKAIQNLYNPKGFFMMVEGGKIDWACHGNDAASMFYELIAFSDAVSKAVEFYKAHPNETLIIVTADHETGGFSLGNKDNKYDIKLSVFKNQKGSKDRIQELFIQEFAKEPKPTFKHMLETIKASTGLGDDKLGLPLSDSELKQLQEAYNLSIKPNGQKKASNTNYLSAPIEKLSSTSVDILDRKGGIGWTSNSHTGSPVPVFIMGNGSDLFIGKLDNTDIPKLILKSSFNN